MSDAAQIFSEAYDLIEQGDLAQARQLLDDIRAENEDNSDFWWLYAHVVEDEQSGREALQRVRQLNANYPGLDNLSEKAGISTPRPLPPPRSPQGLPDLPRQNTQSDLDDDFGDMDNDSVGQSIGNNTRNIMLLVAGVVVIIVFAVLVIPNLFGGQADPTATPTQLAAQFTSVPTLGADTTSETIDSTEEMSVTEEPTLDEIETEVVEPTSDEIESETVEPTPDEVETEVVAPTVEEIATEETSDDGDFTALAAQMTDFDVPEDGVEVGETSLGNTLLVSTCAPAGPASTQAILGIMDALKVETLADDIEAIGFRITNCSDNSVVRTIGITRSQFDDFVSDTITIQELQGLLRPIG